MKKKKHKVWESVDSINELYPNTKINIIGINKTTGKVGFIANEVYSVCEIDDFEECISILKENAIECNSND